MRPAHIAITLAPALLLSCGLRESHGTADRVWQEIARAGIPLDGAYRLTDLSAVSNGNDVAVTGMVVNPDLDAEPFLLSMFFMPAFGIAGDLPTTNPLAIWPRLARAGSTVALIWGEPDAHAATGATLDHRYVSRLLTATYTPQGWSEPTEVLRDDAGLRWWPGAAAVVDEVDDRILIVIGSRALGESPVYHVDIGPEGVSSTILASAEIAAPFQQLVVSGTTKLALVGGAGGEFSTEGFDAAVLRFESPDAPEVLTAQLRPARFGTITHARMAADTWGRMHLILAVSSNSRSAWPETFVHLLSPDSGKSWIEVHEFDMPDVADLQSLTAGEQGSMHLVISHHHPGGGGLLHAVWNGSRWSDPTEIPVGRPIPAVPYTGGPRYGMIVASFETDSGNTIRLLEYK